VVDAILPARDDELVTEADLDRVVVPDVNELLGQARDRPGAVDAGEPDVVQPEPTLEEPRVTTGCDLELELVEAPPVEGDALPDLE
jgi:hypothetical protein